MTTLPEKGEEIFGYKVMDQTTVSMLGARITELSHACSGARVLYIENDDRELGFNLIYRTPQLDQSDSNHILEHLMLCSCSRYPSRDIFFDMDSKSYSTFMNGLTDNTYTCYPVCSQSEDQLLKIMDVFLCCMEEPDALKEDYFFRREALRYELESEDEELSLEGTVFNEDWGHLTDIQENADSFMAETLYEGQTASHLLGRAHFHYKDISFGRIRERFEKFYRYSNCLIVLYGKMDIARVLTFLDKEHLSRFPVAAGIVDHDLLSYFHEPVKQGFFKRQAESPAYEGNPGNNNGIIDYGIDLSGCSEQDLIFWDMVTDILDQDTSAIHRAAREKGLNNVIEVYLDTAPALPSLKFRLHNAKPGQDEEFLAAVKTGLKEVSENGVSSDLFHAVLKENRLSDCLTREAPHLGFHISEEIGKYWSTTDKTGYFTLYENCFDTFFQDEKQDILRRLAGDALTPSLSAVVTTVPKPGLAEAMEEEKEQYLKEKKASLSKKEILKLMEDTKDFQIWNQNDQCNLDFLIQPEDLPGPEAEPVISETVLHDIHCLSSAVSLKGIGCYQLFFDISGLKPSDWNYLTLYQMLLTELDTSHFTVEQQKNKEQELLYDCTFDELYPEREAGKNSHPMMSVFWYGLTEDFEEGLELLLDLMGGCDYEDCETILRVIDKYLPDYDMSRSDNGPSLAYSLTERYIRRDSCFRYLLNQPGMYDFLKEIRDVLERAQEVEKSVNSTDYTDMQLSSSHTPGTTETATLDVKALEAAKQISKNLRRVADCILNKHRLVFLACADENSLASILEHGTKRLSALHEVTEDAPLPDSIFTCPRRSAAAIDSPLEEVRMTGDFGNVSEFMGRHLPFLLAAADKYIKPAIRYQGCAYDSGVDFLLPNRYFTLWSTSDSRIRSTLETFASAGEQLENLAISEEDLRGYILSAYAQALPPSGMLNGRMRFLRRRLFGISTDHINKMIMDIRNSSLKDQRTAAKLIHKILQNSPAAVVGNEKLIEENKDLFDEVMKLHS